MKKIFLYLFFAIIINLTLSPAYGVMDYLDVVIAPQEINFNLKDQYGNITGYTPQGILRQIPNLSSYNFGMKPNFDEAFVGYYDKFHYISQNGSPVQVQSGRYIITLYGITTSVIAKLGIDFGIVDIDEYSKIQNIFIVYPNSIWTYEFTIPDMPPADHSIVLTKVATPSDLIADVNTSNQLGYFTTPGIYNSLLSKAQNAKAKFDAGQTVPGKNIINALITEINAQNSKQINPDAAKVLLEDAQYILAH